ncbi:ribonucleoside-diphosphate reductase subunit alpha [Halobacillus salinus]|uniref:Ribonucleoside-diphosphate reductase n=1 Tax=Halobacillus salinus TaxID=192814 RepID=A0A4Z0GYS0_9BACI|nr:ribonucleoside-diphosphate reductase subunit alpha [Halobacillus salinus]TGB01899.1 ribonucleoside-diphosphate reductase subunit alpha [Halobacillus salinus]
MNRTATGIDSLQEAFPALPIHAVLDKWNELSIEDYAQDMILTCLAEVDESQPDWTFVASRIYLNWMYEQAKRNRKQDDAYSDFYGLLQTLIDDGIYTSKLLTYYSKQDIAKLERAIDPERDHLFTYIGLRTLSDRYLARSKSNDIFELPQERFMIIAMMLMAQEEESKKIDLVLESYWALSNLYMTVATPTLANAGKQYGQLSSCFIDTVDDSLQSIYDSNTDIANLSKNGGGIGVYLGKIRSRGSDIRGFKGVSSGVIPWMKQLNNTAVSVDQLGQRQGAIAVYLDIWHKDIFPFLDSRLNNGDERQRTHDLFTGVSIPDLFMEAVESREDWYLFDPHEVRDVMGYSLEDSYDEERGSGTFRSRYQECVQHPTLSKKCVPAIEIMKRVMMSQLEAGTPYMFYRDEVNRMNPNHHAGMIYCSNLCTEITQNQSPTSQEQHFIEDGKIITEKSPGDFVVCNLSSINLGKAVPSRELHRLITIQVRMLDNVIDLNTIPVLQAQLTNQKYRGIGLGTFGWAHLLAKKNIHWDSEEAVKYAEELYEAIAYYTIEASSELAKEKGSYPMFEGSDWHSGDYFSKRGYHLNGSWNWLTLQEKVRKNGLRNGYLLAVAPNSSTSLIAGSTASIDPVFQKFYSEEKKDYKIPVTAPELDHRTYGYYPSAYDVDQKSSIRQNAARQRYVDQSISFNLYVRNSIHAKELLDLHLEAWKQGLKTTYYTRSTSRQGDYDECESCSS